MSHFSETTQRLSSVSAETAEGRAKELLAKVQQTFGMIPNTAKLMANSPAVLESFLGFSSAMSNAEIGSKLHNQIKLATSESNACEYCTSILSAVAPSAGLSVEDILNARAANSEEPRVRAALAFANDVLEKRGKVNDRQIESLREHGFRDSEIVEIVASVVLGCFTNFLNNVADTELDIPRAEPIETCTASTCSSQGC
ncbi:MAG TPA: carboxymuconolactone decarboxylase family protein [Pirellulaceae bacterium]|nr:carboxymuconolactone decarboxylase family protein [Pirellulaceae bacterium]HMO94074.1 carboxymuconolactone decarboxylase family protein [Pirellulaceae bacterium]HMP70918.1 carboxymuconolactone decarboxylase family protein [Pirellulaceae bacterium]